MSELTDDPFDTREVGGNWDKVQMTYGHSCEEGPLGCRLCLTQKLWPPSWKYFNGHPDEHVFWHANRDIFGRELWLACRLQADRELLLSNYGIMTSLGVKVEEFKHLARQLLEVNGQWGRELWLCAWMIGCSTSLNYWYGVNETNALRDVFIVD